MSKFIHTIKYDRKSVEVSVLPLVLQLKYI